MGFYGFFLGKNGLLWEKLGMSMFLMGKFRGFYFLTNAPPVARLLDFDLCIFNLEFNP
ncbi:MAG: hypothetical protein ACJA0S_000911 [Rickettsiales bacterium]|jgi:hypothetical protein